MSACHAPSRTLHDWPNDMSLLFGVGMYRSPMIAADLRNVDPNPIRELGTSKAAVLHMR